MFLVLISVSALAWLACGPGLAWRMGRRGFDPNPWFSVGLLFGPVAVLLAILAVRQPISALPIMLRRAEATAGTLDALLVVDGTPETWSRVRRATRELRTNLRRLAVVRVVPHGGTRFDEAQAAAQLCRNGESFDPKAGLALLFGRSDDAVSRYAAEEGFDVVVHAGNARFSAALQQRGLRSIMEDTGRLKLPVSDLDAVA